MSLKLDAPSNGGVLIQPDQITTFHLWMKRFIEKLLADFEGEVKDDILDYLAIRTQSDAEIKQDLLPLLVYFSCGGDNDAQAVAIATIWTLYLAAAHFFDEFQDKHHYASVNTGIAALGAANLALAAIEADTDTLQDILDALGRVTVISANAQNVEANSSQQWSKQQYLTNLTGKSASIIATGVWLGGRLAKADSETLAALRQFGIALGLHLQLSDDLADIEEDILHGVFTLPVLEGLANTGHTQHRKLERLLSSSSPNYRKIYSLLMQMGAIERTQRLIRAYQLQVASFFERYPNLEPYFADYVATKH